MMKIERFVFNPFQENTYVIFDDSGEAVIVDPGCYEKSEEITLTDFLEKNNLTPVAQILTHSHIDHILGVSFVFKKYSLKPLMHADALPFFINAGNQGKMYGLEMNEIVEPDTFIEEGSQVLFGNSALDVLHTPGHVDGHLSFLSHPNKCIIVGDVLFRDSIGRTDLPTGNFDVLAHNIRSKIYTLDPDFIVYPGHGPQTTVGFEKVNNPFVSGI